MIERKLGYGLRRIWFDLTAPKDMIAVTHCGKLGDLIACLPITSWLFKTRRKKIHFILARKFAPFTQIKSLLCLQEMTGAVTLAEFPVRDWECGGTPYKFDPRRYYVPCGEYYNLGFRRHPRKFVPEYCAEEHGLSYDPDFKLNLGDYPRTDEILCSDAYIREEVPQATPIDLSRPVLDNAQRMAGARESYVSQSGLFHIFDLAGVKPTRVFIYPHSVNIHLFTPNLDALDVVYVQRDVR
ncbi:MAG TPA: hypothetical protein VGL38_04915 [bacterium]|jgi:hypothetical protein